jgi:CDP-glycerol glycerophosphotransferase (TagB/SpsB family)
VLRSDRLRALAEQHDAQVVFLPHPNMHSYLEFFDVPAHVKLQGYDDEDVRALLARTAVLVTDYSSMSFNLAYMQRPTIYFQFDRAEYTLLHTERPGYFSYEEDGFGPVVEEADAVISELERVLSGDFDPQYTERMRATFPVRDGRNSERVFEAMRSLSDPDPQAASSNRVAVVPDSWARIVGEPTSA